MRKKGLVLLLIIGSCLLFTLMTAYAADGRYEGSGLSDDPYVLEDLEDFKAFAFTAENATCANETYVLAADLVDDGTLTPIGSESIPFCGTFDGRGHTITLQMESGSTTANLGLFDTIGADGIVQNLNLAGSLSSAQRLGSICDRNLGLIRNCGSFAVLHLPDGTAEGLTVGGICAYNEGVVVNAFFLGTIDVGNASSGKIGGIAASGIQSNTSGILNCYTALTRVGTGSVTVSAIAGDEAAASQMENCFYDQERGASQQEGAFGFTSDGCTDGTLLKVLNDDLAIYEESYGPLKGWDSGANGYPILVSGEALQTEGYSVALTTEGTLSGYQEATLRPGDSFTLSVVVTGVQHCADVTLSYDPSLFEYVSAESTPYLHQADSGLIRVLDYNTSGATINAFTFRSKANISVEKAGAFRVLQAKFSESEAAMLYDAVESTENADASVTILPVFTVTFLDRDGNVIGTPQEVDYNRTATAPEAPNVAGHDFSGWSVGTVVYTKEQIDAAPVTAVLTYTAVYTAKQVSVSVGSGLTGAPTAICGVDYQGTINNYDPTYRYTVTATSGGNTIPVTQTGDTFLISGDDILEDLTITVSKTSKIEVAVFYGGSEGAGYVAGYTQVVVYAGSEGDLGEGYTYSREDMYKIRTKIGASEKTAFAILVQGTVTVDEARSAISQTAAAARHDLTGFAAGDVNATGLIDIADARAAFNCQSVLFSVEDYMSVFLLADVNHDHLVNADDINLVLTAAASA